MSSCRLDFRGYCRRHRSWTCKTPNLLTQQHYEVSAWLQAMGKLDPAACMEDSGEATRIEDVEIGVCPDCEDFQAAGAYADPDDGEPT